MNNKKKNSQNSIIVAQPMKTLKNLNKYDKNNRICWQNNEKFPR